MYGLRKDEIKPGMSYRDVLALAVELGIYSGIATDDLLEKRTTLLVGAAAGLSAAESERDRVEVLLTVSQLRATMPPAAPASYRRRSIWKSSCPRARKR